MSKTLSMRETLLRKGATPMQIEVYTAWHKSGEKLVTRYELERILRKSGTVLQPITVLMHLRNLIKIGLVERLPQWHYKLVEVTK